MIKIHPFNEPNDQRGYRIFPEEMEGDSNILFHGTAKDNYLSIAENGFQLKREAPSISFANNSSLALKYACESRMGALSKGVVIAVRFDELGVKGIKKEVRAVFSMPLVDFAK